MKTRKVYKGGLGWPKKTIQTAQNWAQPKFNNPNSSSYLNEMEEFAATEVTRLLENPPAQKQTETFVQNFGNKIQEAEQTNQKSFTVEVPLSIGKIIYNYLMGFLSWLFSFGRKRKNSNSFQIINTSHSQNISTRNPNITSQNVQISTSLPTRSSRVNRLRGLSNITGDPSGKSSLGNNSKTIRIQSSMFQTPRIVQRVKETFEKQPNIQSVSGQLSGQNLLGR
jgi:hypothetical protein